MIRSPLTLPSSLAVLNALQLHTNSSSVCNDAFKFAAAASSQGNLYKAINEVTTAVQHQLQGRSIDFCQLLVTTAHRSNLAHAPECLLDNLRSNKAHGKQRRDPVLIGGALQSVRANSQVIESGPGVSLLAASLPGVALLPFHAKTATLPTFTAQQWTNLLQQQQQGQVASNSSSSTGNSGQCAAILLSSPHFVEVEKLLRRLSNALPGIPVVGGVTERGAWVDTEHQYGALFCGTDVYCLGAVGCIMQGPLSMQQVFVPGCRPAGDIMTVTQASGSVVLSLDDRPVHDAFVSLLRSLSKEDQKRELLLGLCDAATDLAVSSSTAFVARHMSLTSTAAGRPVLQVATHEVPVGTKVQVLVRDNHWNKQQQQAAFEVLAQQLPVADSQLGVFSYCCAALPDLGTDAAAMILPQVPCAGGRMQGEFAGPNSTLLNMQCHAGTDAAEAEAVVHDSMQGGSAQLHSYAASFAVLRHKGA